MLPLFIFILILLWPQHSCVMVILRARNFGTHEKLGVLPLAIIVFYNVSGGPFGVETSVRAGGNFFALLGFLVMPIIWSLAEALIRFFLSDTKDAFAASAPLVSPSRSRHHHGG